MTNNKQSTAAETETEAAPSSSKSATFMKILVSSVLLVSAIATFASSQQDNEAASPNSQHRRLLGDAIPSYMEGLMKDLKERKKLFQETPPEEVKYWFEYTGPLQVRASRL